MIVDTKTGEIYERPPRLHWDTKRMRRGQKRHSASRDIIVALALYSFGATLYIIGTLQ